MFLQNNSNILIAEDDDDDYLLIQEVLEEVAFTNPVTRVKNGAELVKYLESCLEEKRGILPAFIFLDLNMPQKNGMEALREIKSNKDLKSIPIIMLTTSNAPKDVLQSYELGSNAYVTKPASYVGYIDAMQKIMGFWKGINQYA